MYYNQKLMGKAIWLNQSMLKRHLLFVAQYLFSLLLVTKTKTFLWGFTINEGWMGLSPLQGWSLCSTSEPIRTLHYPGYKDSLMQGQAYGPPKAGEIGQDIFVNPKNTYTFSTTGFETKYVSFSAAPAY